MRRNSWRRAATTLVAATSAIAMSAPGAGAVGAGPAVFSGSAEALTLDLTVGTPAGLLDAVTGGGALNQRISSTVSVLDSAGTVDAVAKLLSGLLNESLASGGETTGRKAIVEQNLAGVVDVGAGTMEYTADAVGKLSRSFSELAHLKVSLAPLFQDGSPVPAEVRDTLQDAVQTATGTVNDLVGDLNGALTTVEQTVNDSLEGVEGATGVDVPSVLPDQLPELPDITQVSLIDIKKLWSESTVTTDADAVVSNADAGLLEASLLGGLVKVPAFQYSSIARTNGKPGGASADTVTKVIAVQLADDTIVGVEGQTLTVGDFTLDLNDPQLAGIDANALLGPVESLLGQILDTAGLSVAQGEGTTFVAPDGSLAKAATSAFSLGLRPLNAASAVSPQLAGLLDVRLDLLPTAAEVKAAGAPVEAASPPPAAPAPPAPVPAVSADTNLPRTGGGAIAIVAGLMAMAGAVGLRRRL
ncbi:MAG TPA: hypothetical protein VHF25_16710 [Nitriliruptorales bacterium]|nr:hypothetical protein [Nitriliruptorales bacterium]